jgi:hypothetical protein
MKTNTSLVALLALSLVSFACGGDTPGAGDAAAPATQSSTPDLKPQPTPEIEAATRAIAALRPFPSAATRRLVHRKWSRRPTSSPPNIRRC